MLDKVRHMWVEGMLEQSLYQVSRIELGMAETSDSVEHPWKLVTQQPGLKQRELQDCTPMIQVFDQFDQSLLLLGEPGSGKTTLLLELARDLIERAKKDDSHPIPVVFNLSSWALVRNSLANWLVDELNQRYDVPRKIAQVWIESDAILPLLDGLDEVAREHRNACVEVINAFRAEHGLLPLAVCSRIADYEMLSVKLRLQGAVRIHPFSREQIEGYLERAGKALSGVRAALRDDETLWELLDTPLMLIIIALTYQGQMGSSTVRISRLKGSLEEMRTALFDAYIEAILKRRSTDSPYSHEQTFHWLSWLAQAMVKQDQTVFYLERMQPDWLSKAQARVQRISYGLGVGLVLGLGGGLVFGLDKGLGAAIQHGLLRLGLWRYNYAPLNYVKFLEHAKDLLLLRRVGGGYIFVHRLLMEHFAGLEVAKEEIGKVSHVNNSD